MLLLLYSYLGIVILLLFQWNMYSLWFCDTCLFWCNNRYKYYYFFWFSGVSTTFIEEITFFVHLLSNIYYHMSSYRQKISHVIFMMPGHFLHKSFFKHCLFVNFGRSMALISFFFYNAITFWHVIISLCNMFLSIWRMIIIMDRFDEAIITLFLWLKMANKNL